MLIPVQVAIGADDVAILLRAVLRPGVVVPPVKQLRVQVALAITQAQVMSHLRFQRGISHRGASRREVDWREREIAIGHLVHLLMIGQIERAPLFVQCQRNLWQQVVVALPVPGIVLRGMFIGQSARDVEVGEVQRGRHVSARVLLFIGYFVSPLVISVVRLHAESVAAHPISQRPVLA